MKDGTILKYLFSSILMIFILSCSEPTLPTNAAELSAVSIGTIDYEKLTLQVFDNNNSVLYYSTDNKTWTEVEGAYHPDTRSYLMDISWLSAASDVILYLKGDIVKKVIPITLPAQNTSFRVAYSKANGDFIFQSTGGADTFEWRKSNSYDWIEVSLNENSNSYQAFLSDMEILRIKGAKISIRTPQESGNGILHVGERPSKEIAVTIPPRDNAPVVKVNTAKLSLSTTALMEFYNEETSLWDDCSKAMTVSELVPDALFENGSKDITIMLRTAATSNKTYSKTAYVTVFGQPSPPTLGDNSCDITYYYNNSKLILQFNKASATVPYEYTYAKSKASFDAATARWISVSTSKAVTIPGKTIPDGSIVFLRKKGTDENLSKNIRLMLPSAVSSLTVKY